MSGVAPWKMRGVPARCFHRGEFGLADAEADVSPKAILARARDASPDDFLAEALADDPYAVEPDEDEGPVGDQHLTWPALAGSTALLFLPTPHSWETLAYLHWYAASGYAAEPFIALLARWHERFGAELVAHYGTILQFVVERPPTSLAEATILAREQILAAPSTTELAGVSFQEHARVLVGRKRWFLHESP